MLGLCINYDKFKEQQYQAILFDMLDNQLKNQIKPAGMEWEEWEHTKLQEAEVIKRLKRFAKATQAHKRNQLNVKTKKACLIQITAFKDLKLATRDRKNSSQLCYW